MDDEDIATYDEQSGPYSMGYNTMIDSDNSASPDKQSSDTEEPDKIQQQQHAYEDQGHELHSPKTVDIPLPVQVLANVNCQEKIVICIDISSEMSQMRYRAKAGTAFSGIDIIKRALKLFISNKQMICRPVHKHSFALMLLLDQALWLTDFTSNINELFTQIDSLEALEEHSSTFDMSSIFDILLDKAKLPICNIVENPVPPYVVRVILIYGRSHCMPVFTSHESQNLITGSPCFFMDVIYLHEAPHSDNQSEEIYHELCELDDRGFSHVFDISKTPTKVFDAVGKLVAHPLQRPIQSQSGYKLDPMLDYNQGDVAVA